MQRHHSRGQSLPEYAMLVGLLILGSMAALQFFSGSVSEKSSQMWSSFNPQGQLATAAGPGVTVTAGGATANSGDPPVVNTGGISTGEAGAEGSNDTSGYASIQDQVNDALDWESALNQKSVGDYMDSLPAAMLAKAQELEAQGVISSGEATEIKNLANEGYRLAGAMRVVENALLANQNLPDAEKLKIPVQYEGKTMTVQELSDELGLGNMGYRFASSVNDYLPHTPKKRGDGYDGSLAKAFIKQYQQVAAMQAMQTPETAQLLNELSFRILTSADVVEMHMSQWAYDSGKTDTNNIKDLVVRGMKETTASSSEVICSVGYGETAGYSCN